MPVDLTRGEFLATVAAPLLAPHVVDARPAAGRLLIVVAHPDDEYACAATTYRLVRELGWSADQVVITNGEGGYRYSTLAETVYGKPLVPRSGGHADLVAIRKDETLRAGRILGVDRHFFLDQKDLGFTNDPATADAGYWDRGKVVDAVRGVLAKGNYDLVLTLRPTPETHTHHRAAAQIVLEAAGALAADRRPLILGAEARARADAGEAPALEFDRAAHFGYHDALDYQIVVNWVIAEYKSQGLFQKDSGKHDLEQFWALGPLTERATATLERLRAAIRREE